MAKMDAESSGLIVATAAHPTELVEAGTVTKEVGIAELRQAIPPYCFKPSYLLSFYYLTKDLVTAAILLYIAIFYIPTLPNVSLRITAYILYGFLQGLVGTGLWVLAHECGHAAFSTNKTLNNIIGWVLHSALLTPYFSWKSTHARHHIYAGHMDKDQNYVPLRRKEYAVKMNVTEAALDELSADAPIVTFLRIVLQQSIGWVWYMLSNITAGKDSTGVKKSKGWWNNSHIDPKSSLFRSDEFWAIVASDVGLATTMSGLWYAGTKIGSMNFFLLYGVPYMWVNHWIVAITYLHHTHPTIPKYEDNSWTFLKGALATIDRDFGFIGRNLFHGIIECHVIHHLFSRIPFYYCPTATAAIIPILGSKYHREPATSPFSFPAGLWQAFTECQWVQPDVNHDAKAGEENALWYHMGPSPAPEVKMRMD